MSVGYDTMLLCGSYRPRTMLVMWSSNDKWQSSITLSTRNVYTEHGMWPGWSSFVICRLVPVTSASIFSWLSEVSHSWCANRHRIHSGKDNGKTWRTKWLDASVKLSVISKLVIWNTVSVNQLPHWHSENNKQEQSKDQSLWHTIGELDGWWSTTIHCEKMFMTRMILL